MNDKWAKTQDVHHALKLLKAGQLWTNYRKFRLFACACCTLSVDLIDERYRNNILIGERLADAEVSNFDRSKYAANINVEQAAELGWGEQAATLCVLEGDRKVALWVASYMQSCYMDDAVKHGIDRMAARKTVASKQLHILHNIFGHLVAQPPVNARYKERSRKIAEVIYRDQSFEDLPVLADSLEDDGVTSESLFAHLRSTGPHYLGTWSLDHVLGKT